MSRSSASESSRGPSWSSELYGLFDNENWKVRWVAAELILRMSDTGQLPEFLDKIGKAPGMAITEPLRYGALIADMKGPKTSQGCCSALPRLGSARWKLA